MKEYKILSKANHLLTINKGSKSIYYKELQKTIKEYKSIKNKDATTINLYLEKISNLCDSLDENKQVNITISMVIITISLMLLITLYSTINYYKIKAESKESIVEIKSDITFNIEYKNLDTFSPIVYSDINNYQGLKPLTITVKGLSKDNTKKKIKYNVYLVEDNNGILESDLVPRNVFRYSVKESSKTTGIKSLNNSVLNDGRILLFTNETDSGVKNEIYIYMWMERTSNNNYLDKLYNFKIEVEGYEVKDV